MLLEVSGGYCEARAKSARILVFLKIKFFSKLLLVTIAHGLPFLLLYYQCTSLSLKILKKKK